MDKNKKGLLFDIETPLGVKVRCSESYWQFICTEKHPSLKGKEKEVIETLSNPDEIRKSKKDPNVFLFYRGSKPRWICAVTKLEKGDGYLITAYPTDSVKIGEMVWKKSK
jgi:hypothetical protein